MKKETKKQRSDRIINQLRKKYHGAKAFDLDGRGEHFVCEVESTKDHPEYDRAIEVIISSKPHKHLKMTQHYTILSGALKLHVNDEVITLKSGDKYTISPNNIHWATSKNECWLEIYSKPGWTKQDHIPVDQKIHGSQSRNFYDRQMFSMRPLLLFITTKAKVQKND